MAPNQNHRDQREAIGDNRAQADVERIFHSRLPNHGRQPESDGVRSHLYAEVNDPHQPHPRAGEHGKGGVVRLCARFFTDLGNHDGLLFRG